MVTVHTPGTGAFFPRISTDECLKPQASRLKPVRRRRTTLSPSIQGVDGY
jgi:hypothetical protein